MRQIVQHLGTGLTELLEAPQPSVQAGTILIQTTSSLISAGTERMLVGFGKASILEKARQQPDKVKMLLEKIQSDGLMTTIEAVQSKLAQPLPLGYCSVGVVAEVGIGVEDLKMGERVVSNGPHADVVRVPKHLCARIPDAVDDESAAFVVVSSIGLQGIRLSQPTLGETFVVTGVGLIGLLTVQLLRAHGCRVLAIDFDEAKLALARQYGAATCNLSLDEDPVAAGMAFSRGLGVDGVIITASTKSNDPVTQAARMSRKRMSRKRGRIVLVGVTGLELNRADFYEKELTFQVSCSYGPGRYDPNYEDKGWDYPVGFVRWTERRNFEAVLDMLASGQLDVKPLITNRFAFEDAPQAYQTLTEDKSSLGILLQYTSPMAQRTARSVILGPAKRFDVQRPVLGFIGAGNYASRILIPAFKAAGAQFHTVVTAGGINGVIHGQKAGFAEASTDVDAMLASPAINTVVMVTRHDTHAHFVARALRVGKNAFVEKPLAINHAGLVDVQAAYADAQQSAGPSGNGPQLMVGFNRRFSPHVQKMKALLQGVKQPKAFLMTMNAGAIPASHWTQDNAVGGGRIIGEACHFIDLMRYLAGTPVVSIQARRMGDAPGVATCEDKASITLGFEDGSFGTILYLANGATSFPKERVEVFAAGRVLQLNNFRKLKGYGWPGFDKLNLWKQDKGQKACAAAFLRAVESGVPAIPPGEIFEVARVTIDVADQLRRQ
jgi:threonine dehydrogenase-like Zn-dependent dehydrogenase/predicted dehydrogenase